MKINLLCYSVFPRFPKMDLFFRYLPTQIIIFTFHSKRQDMYKKILVIIISILISIDSFSCTTAIISGKATSDGRPLLWKHRDSDDFNNKMVFIKGAKYDYIGLVNSDDSHCQVWGGTNSAGFSIVNSASYNLKPKDDRTEKKDQEGIVMRIALENCATLEDFKRLLDTLPKPLGVETNFGVIDTTGGAAYFETDNFKYTVYDVNNPKIAPDGYLIRTNYSFSGRENEGAGYNRYITANALIKEALKSKKLTSEFFLTKATLSLRQELTKTDLTLEFKKLEGSPNRIYPLRDYIVRYYSSSTLVVQGVKKGESASRVTTWIKLGFQPASISIPLWVSAGEVIPSILSAPEKQNSKLCNFSLFLKKDCFPYIKWKEGDSYVSLEKLGNKNNDGFLQLNVQFDKEVIARGETLISKWNRTGFDEDEAQNFYKEINQSIALYYAENYNLR